MIYVKQHLSLRMYNIYKTFCGHLITSITALVCIAVSVCVCAMQWYGFDSLRSHSHQSLGKVSLFGEYNSIIGIICVKRAKGGRGVSP